MAFAQDSVQDDGAFAIAQALKANEDVKITSLNLANNFFTKFGQVTCSLYFLVPGNFVLFIYLWCICMNKLLICRVPSLMQETMYTR